MRRGPRARRSARRGLRRARGGARRREHRGRLRGGRAALSRPEDLLIRPATVADAAAIARVLVAGWRAGYAGLVGDEVLAALDTAERERRWAGQLEDCADVLLAEVDGRVIGFASLAVPARGLDAPDAGEITALYVEPEHWRRGVGRALVDAAAAELRDEGCDVIVVWTFADSAPSRAFYAAIGLEPDGARTTHEHTGLAEVRLRGRLD